MGIYGRWFQEEEEKKKRVTPSGNLYGRLTTPRKEILETKPARPSRLAQIKQRLAPVGKFLLEKRKQLGEAIIEATPIKRAYGPAPEGVPGSAEELKKLSKAGFAAKAEDRYRTFASAFVTARTGGIIKPEYTAEDNMTNKVISHIASAAGSIATVRTIGSTVGGVLDGVTRGSIPLQTLLARFPLLEKYGYPLIKNAIAFNIYGQLDPDLQDRLGSLAKETLKSIPYTATGFIGKAKLSVPASFTLGFSMAKLEGATIEDALISGTIFGALDAFGRLKAKDREFVTGRAADKVTRLESIETINRYSEVKLSSRPTEAEVNTAWKSAAKKAHPDVGGTDAAMRAVTFARDYLLGKEVTLADIKTQREREKPTEAKARKPGEIPKGLPPAIREEVAKPKEPLPPIVAPEVTGKYVPERQAVINETNKILDDLPTVTPKLQEQADTVIKEAVRVETKSDLQIVREASLQNFRLVAAKFKTAQKKVERPDAVFTYGEKAKDYTSVGDFAKAEYSAKPSDQIGFMDASKIKARDPIDPKAVKEYEGKIEAGETIEPIEIMRRDDGELETIEGSQRVTAYQNLGKDVPAIFRGEEKIAGLQTFQGLYDEAVKKAKEGVGITFKMIDKETIEKYAAGVPYREKIVKRVPLESIKSITMDKMLESPTGELFDISGRDKEDIFLTGRAGEHIRTTFEKIKDYKRLVTKKIEKPEIAPPTVEEARVAREAAKELIRVYVKRGDSFESLKGSHLGEMSDGFTASIGGYMDGKSVPGTKIQVTEVGGKEVSETFSLKKLYDEIKEEVKAPPVEKKPAPKDFGLKSLHLKEGKAQRLAAAGIETKANLNKMSADEVADLWTKSVSDRATKDKLLEASRKLSISKREGEKPPKPEVTDVYDRLVAGFSNLKEAETMLGKLMQAKIKASIVDVPTEGVAGAVYHIVAVKDIKDLAGAMRAVGIKPPTYLEKKPPAKPKAPPKKKPTKVLMKPSTIKRALGKPAIPVLELAKVKDGAMTFNNLVVEITLPTKLKDGIYEIVGDDFIATKVPMDEFPAPVLDTKPVAKIDFKTLKKIFNDHKKIADKTGTRPILAGTLFEFGKDKLRVVSTDGYRLTVNDYKVKVSKPVKFVSTETGMLAKFINLLGEGEVEIGHVEGKNNDSFMSLDSAYAKIVGREIAGEFPTYPKIFPAFRRRYTVDKGKLKDAVKALKPYSKEASNIFNIRIDEKAKTLTVAAEAHRTKGEPVARKEFEMPLKTEKIKTPNNGVSEGTLVMPVRQEEGQGALVTKDGARVSAFNLNYFSDALTILEGDNVHIQTGDPVAQGYRLIPIIVADKITEVPKVPSGAAKAVGEFSNIKSARKNLNFYKVVQFPELVRLTKQLTGEYPRVNRRLRTAMGRAVLKLGAGAKVDLHPDIFKDNEVVGKVLAHELGHIADYFPEMIASRGNLVGRVASLVRYMKKEFEELDDAVLRGELKALTQAWAPFDETLNPNYTKYRFSSKELYADAVSVLFNDPALLKERAPEFWKGFFEYLDEKPKVKENVFAIWDLLNKGEGAVLSERQKSIREMFNKGEDAFLVAVEEKRIADKDVLFKLKYELIDRNQLVIDKVEALKKQGIGVSDELNPVYWLEGHNYVGGITKVFMEENIQPIYRELKAANLSWEDLGEVLFLDRVIHERGAVQNPFDYLWQHADEVTREHYLSVIEGVIEEAEGASIRSFSATKQYKLFKKHLSGEEYKNLMGRLPKGIANPLGFGRDTAQPQREFLKKQLGPEKWKILSRQLAAFRKAIKSIVLEAEDEGFYNPDLIKEMKANPAYATFQVLDYLDINIPASIKHQVGTLKEISNPASATVVKTISTIRAIERNKVKKKIIGFVEQYYPKEIEPAKTVWTGKTHKPVEPRGRDKQTKALFTAMVDGKYKGFYVDPYIAKTMEYMGTGQANAVIQTIRFFNSKLFRPMFITFNLGFQSFNLMRDFLRFYKNTPQLSLARAVRRYKQAARPAFRRAWDIPDETIAEMQKEKMLGITYNDVIAGMTTADKQIDFAIAKAGLSPLTASKRRFFIKPFIPIFEVIEKTGNFIETLPKVAGYKELNGKMPKQELASFIRASVGSPDFLRRGAGYGWYNEVFLFSNAIKEGVRADANVAFKNPRTRAGFWWKTGLINFLPKLIMFGGLMGLFGDWIKKMLEDVSEYDKTNYTVIPLGRKNNLTTYVRIPQSETGRLLGGLFWKALRITNNNKPIMKDITDLLSYTGGQIPSVSPIIDVVTSTAQFVAGKNPYDFFRGRSVIPDDQFEAGGKYALKPFLTWQLNQVGAGIFFKTYTSTQPIEGKGWVQKTIEAPLLSNIIGRWIKISNYGQREKNKAIVSGERREAAQRRIEERERVNDAVKEYRAGTQNMTQRRRIERGLVKDVVGDAPYRKERKAKKTNLIKKFHLALIKGESDENINALIYAQSNDEKVALLVRIQEEMEKADFEALLKRLKQEKIISKNVVSALRKVK